MVAKAGLQSRHALRKYHVRSEQQVRSLSQEQRKCKTTTRRVENDPEIQGTRESPGSPEPLSGKAFNNPTLASLRRKHFTTEGEPRKCSCPVYTLKPIDLETP